MIPDSVLSYIIKAALAAAEASLSDVNYGNKINKIKKVLLIQK